MKPTTVTTAVNAVAAAAMAGFPVLKVERRIFHGAPTKVVFHLDAEARPVIDRFFAEMQTAIDAKERALAEPTSTSQV